MDKPEAMIDNVAAVPFIAELLELNNAAVLLFIDLMVNRGKCKTFLMNSDMIVMFVCFSFYLSFQ